VTATPALKPGRQGLSGAVWVALLVVYVVWGSTYLGIRILVTDVPPLIAMGVRFVIAAGIIATIVRLRSGPGALRVSAKQWRSASLLGLLFIACGNGGVAIAEQTVTSGLAALLVAAMPLWVVLMRFGFGHEHPRALTWIGTLLGIIGIAVLARPDPNGDVELWGVFTVLGATVMWATGVFSSPRLTLPADPFVTTVYEMLAGGLVMAALSVPTGEWTDFDVAAVPMDAWLAFVYLTVIGSVIAFSAFVWLLKHAPVSLVTTYAFVNPVVAVFLGWLILSEPVTTAILIGGGLAVVGVAMVVRGERQEPVEGEIV